jgi:hypothetical protein
VRRGGLLSIKGISRSAMLTKKKKTKLVVWETLTFSLHLKQRISKSKAWSAILTGRGELSLSSPWLLDYHESTLIMETDVDLLYQHEFEVLSLKSVRF